MNDFLYLLLSFLPAICIEHTFVISDYEQILQEVNIVNRSVVQINLYVYIFDAQIVDTMRLC